MATSESTKKRWIAAAVVVILLATATFGAWIWSSLGYITTDDARVKADIVTISAEVDGRITALLKREGDAVEFDEIMVELDTHEILIRIDQHKAVVDYRRSQQLKAERELSHAESVQQREIKHADLLAKKARVRDSEAVLRELKFQLSLMTLRSPVSGVVVRKNSHRGEFVQAGQPVFMVVDSSHYWVEANVDETQIRYIQRGSDASVKLDSYPGLHFDGTVVDVGAATTSEFSLFSPQKLTGVFIKSTQKLPVKIAVENTKGILRVGMLAVVRIEKPAAP